MSLIFNCVYYFKPCGCMIGVIITDISNSINTLMQYVNAYHNYKHVHYYKNRDAFVRSKWHLMCILYVSMKLRALNRKLLPLLLMLLHLSFENYVGVMQSVDNAIISDTMFLQGILLH